MRFKDMPYEHIAYEDIERDYGALLDVLEKIEDPQEFEEQFFKINDYRSHMQTMMTLCMIRHSIDTADPFYDQEQEYWDETAPKISALEDRLNRIALNFKRRDDLKRIPAIYFKMCEYALKIFTKEIIEDSQIENKLVSEYGKLKASAKIELDGDIHNLASIGPLLTSNDRELRKRAALAVNSFYTENEKEFDRIYDELVKVRDRKAKKLGFKDYVEYAYYNMMRLDYDRDMVANYRKQVLEDIVPVTREIYKAQKERLGLDRLRSWDLNYAFKSGNPRPVGDEPVLVMKAKEMYRAMGQETGDFFDMMCEEELFDLTTKPNKEMGGYMAPIPEFKRPFIFSNFNGTKGDVEVLTHEAGHSFQTYMTYKYNDDLIMELVGPTMEACEIHSMSMEFFTHPYMESFFGKDTEKFLYSHIADALTFIPYGILVDHFQHEVYEHPEMTAEERKATWHRLEKLYCPDRDHEGLDLLERGGWFYRQGHIYQSPFYYIDYTLAQVCALQFFTRMLKGDPDAFKDYIELCKVGGNYSFLELLKIAHLKSPFSDGSLKEVATTMMEELDKFDVSNL